MHTAEGTREYGVPRDQAPDWRRALPTILAVFLVTRLLLVLVASVVEFSMPQYDGRTWDERPILRSLTGSDAVYYLGIAEEGYHLEPVKENYRDWAFFPLYPLVTRLVSVLTLGDVTIAGILVANASFLGAMAALYLLALRHLERDVALRSVVYLAIAPGAVAFAMAYSESLFLLLAAGAFLAAERSRWGVVAVLYALASLCRLPGVLLAIPLAVVLLRESGFRPTLSWASLAAGPAALVGFYAYLGVVVGDPLANLHAQAAWNIPSIVANGGPPVFSPLPFILIGTLLLYVFLFVYVRADRLPVQHVVLAIVAVITVIASGRLQSVGRYVVVAWPFSWILAKRRAASFHASWIVLSGGLFTLHAMLHFTQLVAP